jgi:hypothetical protein
MTDLKAVMNGMVGRLHSFTAAVVRFARENSVQGRLGVQMTGDYQKGDWLDIIQALNAMSYNHSEQVSMH